MYIVSICKAPLFIVGESLERCWVFFPTMILSDISQSVSQSVPFHFLSHPWRQCQETGFLIIIQNITQNNDQFADALRFVLLNSVSTVHEKSWLPLIDNLLQKKIPFCDEGSTQY